MRDKSTTRGAPVVLALLGRLLQIARYSGHPVSVLTLRVFLALYGIWRCLCFGCAVFFYVHCLLAISRELIMFVEGAVCGVSDIASSLAGAIIQRRSPLFSVYLCLFTFGAKMC